MFKSNFPSISASNFPCKHTKKTVSAVLVCAKFSPKYAKVLRQGVNQISPAYQYQTFPVNVPKTVFSLLVCSKFSRKYLKTLRQGINQISPAYQHQNFTETYKKTTKAFSENVATCSALE